MATRTTLGASRLPVPVPEKRLANTGALGGKNSNPARNRLLSLVEPNIRNGSKSSISSYTEDIDAGDRKQSIKSASSADGARKQQQKKKRTPASNKGTQEGAGNRASSKEAQELVGTRPSNKGTQELVGPRASSKEAQETRASCKGTQEVTGNRSSNKENRPPRLEKYPFKPTIEVIDIAEDTGTEEAEEEGAAAAATTGQQEEEEETEQLPPGVINIDIEDGLYEYSKELTVYLMSLEKRFVLESDFLTGGSVTSGMRGMLVDWLIQVQHHMSLCQETLYIAIAILDTTLARRDINADKLQLVGVTAILIASKLEEYYPADLAKLVHLTSDSYTVRQILKMEKVLLEVLNFEIYFPEVMSFLRRYVRAALREQDTIFLETCQYLVDSSLVLSSYSTSPPSKQAAASVLATNCLFAAGAGQPVSLCDVWSTSLEFYTSYQASDVSILALTMLRNVIKPLYEGALAKYKSSSRHQRLVLLYHLSPETVERAWKELGEA